MIKLYDIVIVGAGPVGLMCAYLGNLCGLDVLAIDKSKSPLEVGRADALNARTLQLLEMVGLFDELYPKGRPCNTSSVWSEGKFISRASSWWDNLEGCFHKHFLMLGQSHVEKLLDRKLKQMNSSVLRETSVQGIELNNLGVEITLSNGEVLNSKYLIGADGSRSFVRERFQIPFELVRPEITWAVVDGIIDTSFPKAPEIIVFQAETSDVAWIPREGEIDRFYIRMDRKDFTFEEVLKKINRAMKPHNLTFKEIEWFSQFSVKESVADSFSYQNRVFLAGDSCHVHSVNGGQGLNTGLADAFNLIWKICSVIKGGSSENILNTYEAERKPVAQSVIETSGALVRSTKYSIKNTHALDYIKLVERYAGNITGMGIQYHGEGRVGERVYDIELVKKGKSTRLYSMLDYSKYTLLWFGDEPIEIELPQNIKVLKISSRKIENYFTAGSSPYGNCAVLVRPDSYIAKIYDLSEANKILKFN